MERWIYLATIYGCLDCGLFHHLRHTPPGDRLPRPIEVTINGRIHQGFELTRRKISELDFLLESSSYLSGWQTETRATEEILHSVDDISERIRIINPDPTGTQRRHFIRLKVQD